jgi:hypothetical protein
MKSGKVGIQGELQIGREEKLWILLQAPLEIRCLDFRIPFHNHEEEEEEEEGEEGERKERDLRYLPCSYVVQREGSFV